MNVEIGPKAEQFLFWEYLFWIYGIVSLQLPEKDSEEDGEDDNDGEWDVHAVHQPHRGHTPPPE